MLTRAAYNHEKYPDVSKHYHLIKTDEIVSVMEKNNWFPVSASQVNSKKKINHCKHLVVFRNPDLKTINGVAPQIVAKNAHDRSSSLQFMAGLIRFICANGLIVSDAMFETFRIHHNRFAEERIQVGIEEIITRIPLIIAKTEQMNTIVLNQVDRLNLASNIIERVWEKRDKPVNPAQLLSIRRNEDSNPTLWNTYNVIQENIINPNGGIYGQTSTGKQRKMRNIKNINRLVSFNKIMWEEAEKIMEAA